MEIELILSFLVTSILLTLMPGPDVIFVLTESLTKGYKNGRAVSVGLSLGVLVHTSAAATGLSVLLVNSEIVFQFVKYIGAAYLLYLAFQAYGEKPPSVVLDTVTSEEYHFGKLVQKGFLMNVLNPKVSLFFIVFLPQFISKSGAHIAVQMFFLGFLFMLQSCLIFIGISRLAGKLSTYLNNSRFWEITKWVKIIVLVGLAIMLVL